MQARFSSCATVLSWQNTTRGPSSAGCTSWQPHSNLCTASPLSAPAHQAHHHVEEGHADGDERHQRHKGRADDQALSQQEGEAGELSSNNVAGVEVALHLLLHAVHVIRWNCSDA